MTRQQIEFSKFICLKVLPALQKIERSLYFNDNIDITIITLKRSRSLAATIYVYADKDLRIQLCRKTFYFDNFPYMSKESVLKVLRGVRYFIGNWQMMLQNNKKK